MATYDREKDIQNLMKQDPELTRAQAEAQVDQNRSLNTSLSADVSKGGFNTNLGNLLQATEINSLATTGDNAKIAREATEGSKIGLKINETASGFQSLTVTTDEGETVTVEPTVALMTNAVDGGGVKVTRTSGSKTDITTLTGKTTSDGFLTTVITQGSPKGIEQALKATVTTNQNILKAKIQESSVNPTVASENVGVDISENVAKQVTTKTKEFNVELGNPFGSLFGDIAGAAGNPFANILANLSAIATGAIQRGSAPNATTFSIPTEIRSVVPGLPNVNTLPGVSTTFNQKLPYPTDIIKTDGSTNINQIISKNQRTSSEVKPTDVPTETGKIPGGWKGFSTKSADYKQVFTIVNGANELESELRKAVTDRPLTCMVVTSSRTATNEQYDASNDQDKWKYYYSAKFSYESWWDTYVGARSHYFILRDGSIQRGRPISIRLFQKKASASGFNEKTVYVKMVGGLNLEKPYDTNLDLDQYVSDESYTPAQWRAFEILCKTFRKVVPGGEAISIDEMSPNIKSAGFNARDWTKSRFGWETLYTGENSLESRVKNKLGPFEMEEISKYLPAKVAKPTVTPVETKPTPAPKPEKVADPQTGLPPEKTVEEKLNDEERLRQIEEEIDELVKENNKLMDEKGPLYGSTTNNAKIVAINEKIKVIDAKIIELEKEADEIESRLYPGTEYEKQLNSLKYDLKDAEERLANAQAETRTAPDPNRPASIQRKQAASIASRPKRIATAKEDITRLKSEIAAIEKKQKKAIDHQNSRR